MVVDGAVECSDVVGLCIEGEEEEGPDGSSVSPDCPLPVGIETLVSCLLILFRVSSNSD